MKLTEQKLRKIIREELLNEVSSLRWEVPIYQSNVGLSPMHLYDHIELVEDVLDRLITNLSNLDLDYDMSSRSRDFEAVLDLLEKAHSRIRRNKKSWMDI